jgi:hypothetical protein
MNALIRPSRILLIFGLIAILVAGVVFFVTASLAAEKATIQVTTPAPPPLQPSPATMPYPQVTIVAPANLSSVPAGDVTVSVKVNNFNSPGKMTGFIFYYMDVEPPTGAFIPATTTPGTYIPTIETSYTWSNVQWGWHTFSVMLTNQDFTPLMPLTMAKITLRAIGTTETSDTPAAPLPILTPSTMTKEVTPSPRQTGVVAQLPTAPESTKSGSPHEKLPSAIVWIVVGMGVVGVAGTCVYFLLRNKNP